MILLSRWWWAVSGQNYQLSEQLNQKPNIAGSTWNPKPVARFLSYTHLLKVLQRIRKDESLKYTHKTHLEDIQIPPSRQNKAARKAGWESWLQPAAASWMPKHLQHQPGGATSCSVTSLQVFGCGISCENSACTLTFSGRKHWMNKACAVSKAGAGLSAGWCQHPTECHELLHLPALLPFKKCYYR